MKSDNYSSQYFAIFRDFESFGMKQHNATFSAAFLTVSVFYCSILFVAVVTPGQ